MEKIQRNLIYLKRDFIEFSVVKATQILKKLRVQLEQLKMKWAKMKFDDGEIGSIQVFIKIICGRKLSLGRIGEYIEN